MSLVIVSHASKSSKSLIFADLAVCDATIEWSGLCRHWNVEQSRVRLLRQRHDDLFFPLLGLSCFTTAFTHYRDKGRRPPRPRPPARARAREKGRKDRRGRDVREGGRPDDALALTQVGRSTSSGGVESVSVTSSQSAITQDRAQVAGIVQDHRRSYTSSSSHHGRRGRETKW